MNKKYINEMEIKYVATLDHIFNNREAAKYLNIHINTWAKHAKLFYTDEGITWFEYLKRRQRPKPKKKAVPKLKKNIEPYLLGEVDGTLVNVKYMKRQLIEQGYRNEECEDCGYCERRLTDYQVPLAIVLLDGNVHNLKSENLKLVCYNCYATMYQPDKQYYSTTNILTRDE